ncbi:MAG: phosphoribosyl-ATP diphosphatase [Treponema sp.]|jgi:phosphoribosyl-ATP pyrophosphohydrolase/phosphoribosyl-AMP cyclohydrolase|nr:phosphoribosyl-ATP diphosphatase [Treponema sp.]
MVIASIDLQGGRVVQLKQGSELVLQRDNAVELAEEFDRYGEVAVIDLDAAMGKGSNIELLRPLLRRARCRVGGGIRSPEQARELVSLGAEKIIAGSQVFRDPEKRGAGIAGGEFAVNIPFLEALIREIGRERLIVAVDAGRRAGGGYEITVDGWKTPTGLDLIEAARGVQDFCGGLLFTCVDREGTMTGLDLEPVRALRDAVSCGITVAGGVNSVEEIEAAAALGCDVQLGMALYTGKVDLAEAFVRSLNWKKGAYAPGLENSNTANIDIVNSDAADGNTVNSDTANNNTARTLLPVIAQSPGGQVLMTGFANREAVAESFKRGNLCFYSRTRNVLWMKGEHSGNTLALLRMRADCDRDAILAVVEPAGPVCHTGAFSCFDTGRRYGLEFLQEIIAGRLRNPSPGSYTAALDDDLVREKVMEEAEELCRAGTHDELVWEAADLLYFTAVLMTRAGVKVEEVFDELDRRHKK